MVSDFFVNVISDIAFVALGILFFWAYYLLSNRNPLLDFFGITKSKRVIIYLSKLHVISGGALGSDGIPYSFQGTSITYEESKAATKLQSLFTYFLPSQVDKPGFLSKLLIADIDVIVLPSPSKENVIEQNATIISIGLPPYNLVSKNIEGLWKFPAKFDYLPSSPVLDKTNVENTTSQADTTTISGYPQSTFDNSGSVIPQRSTPESFNTSGSTVPLRSSRTQEARSAVRTGRYPPNTSSKNSKKPSIRPVIVIQNISPYSDTSIGFVQRTFDTVNKRNIFYVAGLSENSTAGSAYFLAKNWQYLLKKYGNETAFLVLLKIDNNNNHLYEIVLEK